MVNLPTCSTCTAQGLAIRPIGDEVPWQRHMGLGYEGGHGHTDGRSRNLECTVTLGIHSLELSKDKQTHMDKIIHKLQKLWSGVRRTFWAQDSLRNVLRFHVVIHCYQK